MSTPEVQPISNQVSRLQRWFQAVITHADDVYDIEEQQP